MTKLYEKPPCELENAGKCTPRQALQCYELGKTEDEEFPLVEKMAPCFVEEAITDIRKKVFACALKRLTSGQFEKPKKTRNRGPLR